jgi:hypothetical protein
MTKPTSFLSLASLLVLAASAACGGAVSDGDRGDLGGRPAATDPPATRPPPSESDLAGFTAFCAPSSDPGKEELRVFEALAPRRAADYFALRHLEGGFDGPDVRDVITVAERGTRCATATDHAACEAAYDALVLRGLFFNYVFFTRGDEVGIVQSRDDALDLLGGVDSPEEAYFVASWSGYGISCSGETAAAFRPATDGDGFELVAESGGCMTPVDRVVVRVRADGRVEEIDRREISPEQGCM